MKILISGGNSKFANELVRQNTCHELILMARSEMDITELSSIEYCIATPSAGYIFTYSCII
jgi:dTDP-4-dehydrorhamnose reductase